MIIDQYSYLLQHGRRVFLVDVDLQHLHRLQDYLGVLGIAFEHHTGGRERQLKSKRVKELLGYILGIMRKPLSPHCLHQNAELQFSAGVDLKGLAVRMAFESQ
jgi:hypothetical protein